MGSITNGWEAISQFTQLVLAIIPALVTGSL